MLPQGGRFFLVFSFLLVGVCVCSTPKAENIVTIYTGWTKTTDDFLLLENEERDERLLFRDVSWDGRSFTRPLYWGARYHYVFEGGGPIEVGLGLEFVHLKAYLEIEDELAGEGVWQRITPSLEDVVESFSISHGIDLIFANLLLKRGPILGHIGYGVNISHFESTLIGFSHLEETEFGGDAFQAGVGVHLPVWRSIHFYAGYRFTASTPTGAVSGGNEARVQLRTHHFDFGPSFQW